MGGYISLAHSTPNSVTAAVHFLLIAEETLAPGKDQGQNRSSWLEVQVSQTKVHRKRGEDIMERWTVMFSFFLGKNTFSCSSGMTEKVITNTDLPVRPQPHLISPAVCKHIHR